MNAEKTLQLFAKDLNDDLTIGNNHLIDDLPFRFSAPDFFYFYSAKDRFWSEIENEEERAMVSLAMTECYLSALLHVYSGDYQFDERTHRLEDCILYGDLFSGAFSERLIVLDRAALLKDWLVLLQEINKELLTYSLEGRSTEEKKECLVARLVEYLAQPSMREQEVSAACKALVTNVIETMDDQNMIIKNWSGKKLECARDLMAVIGG